MFRSSNNPKIPELTKSHRKRHLNLSDLKPIEKDGSKLCLWCLIPLTGKKYKWCSPPCSYSAYSWANPQSEEGLAYLLAKQSYKCAQLTCQYDWNPLADSLLGSRGIPKALDKGTIFNIRLIKSLKRQSPNGTKPEVDHIIPFAKGGEAIGFDNHQVLCKRCHLEKTKIDNSGKRIKK